MKRWLQWRWGATTTAATVPVTHAYRHYTRSGVTNRPPRKGSHGDVKYRLPLRRALHFIEEGSRRAGLTIEKESVGCTKEDADETAVSGQENADALQHDAARYAAYHCHHMLTSFRAERRRWTASNELPPDDLVRVMEYTFFAAILLHLTALYATADQYCESLIDVAVSCTIFLSKGACELHSTNLRQHRGEQSVAVSPTPPPAAGAAAVPPLSTKGNALRDGPWDSLHWAVVHFSLGVCGWGLLDHTEALLDMERTTSPSCRMLRTFSQIIRDQLKGEILAREDTRYLSYIATRDGSCNWLGAVPSIVCLQGDGHAGATDENGAFHICFAQQRRLQLLPLMWLALLLRHCATLAAADRLRPVRHALLRALPLFSKEARAESAVKLLVRCLYFPPFSSRASSVEMGALLAQMEQHNVFGASSSLALAELLQAWMRADAPQEPAPEVKSTRGAYVAFRNIPRCALHVLGPSYTATQDGEAFVHELLLRAVLQLSFRQTNAAPFAGELRELLLSTHHVALLIEDIGLREGTTRRGGAATLAAEAALRAFAVRVATICATDFLWEDDMQSLLEEFDRVLTHALRRVAELGAVGSPPDVYERNRRRWIRNA
ncbi:hypothetical protein DQ04_00941100 [Trypanosoma grayi]|uniref:hypothetical protein n=1 Tax=Trypanosoma grayi TaxID=71804 RepID=UPI0004F4913D|nr:hypothetical protein DQ04_00941100 [Trypanosoma grayi]KEG13546.1 hypothetical protein DQ04_00941100 [Trypanosoma grayi]